MIRANLETQLSETIVVSDLYIFPYLIIFFGKYVMEFLFVDVDAMILLPT